MEKVILTQKMVLDAITALGATVVMDPDATPPDLTLIPPSPATLGVLAAMSDHALRLHRIVPDGSEPTEDEIEASIGMQVAGYVGGIAERDDPDFTPRVVANIKARHAHTANVLNSFAGSDLAAAWRLGSTLLMELLMLTRDDDEYRVDTLNHAEHSLMHIQQFIKAARASLTTGDETCKTEHSPKTAHSTRASRAGRRRPRH